MDSILRAKCCHSNLSDSSSISCEIERRSDSPRLNDRGPCEEGDAADDRGVSMGEGAVDGPQDEATLVPYEVDIDPMESSEGTRGGRNGMRASLSSQGRGAVGIPVGGGRGNTLRFGRLKHVETMPLSVPRTDTWRGLELFGVPDVIISDLNSGCFAGEIR